MVFMRRRQKKRELVPYMNGVEITDLTHDGRGVAHIEGKATFIEGALPAEKVTFAYQKKRSDFDEGTVLTIEKPSQYRVEPQCKHFGICGGCRLQHLAAEAQIDFKQQQLMSQLRKQARIEPVQWLAPLQSDAWHYRYKARLGVKFVKAKDRVLVGFREQQTAFIVDMQSCPILHKKVSDLLPALSTLIGQLSVSQQLPQIEVAADDERVAFSFRILTSLTMDDEHLLKVFADEHNVLLYLQPGNEATTYPLLPEQGNHGALCYRVNEVALRFMPYHFTQVNPAINRQMLAQATELLALSGDETVLDLFCGLGNFTLTLANQVKRIVGIEGNQSLVDWAIQNAADNKIHHAEFYSADLTKDLLGSDWMQSRYDIVIIDPPRSGALEMMPYLQQLNPMKILYVSCHPATLARDIAILVANGQYRLEKVGVMDMFPHTAHVESMALLMRNT